LAALALVPGNAAAQTPPALAAAADPAIAAQAQALLPVLAGRPGYATLFGPAFRQAVPQGQWDAIVAQLRTTLGTPLRIATITPQGRFAAEIVVGYERGSATMLIAMDPAAPHALTGLRIIGTALAGDSRTAIAQEVARLPGTARLGIYALDGAAPAPLLAIKEDAAGPIGSAFKLWVLKTAADQVAAGQRRWADVVPVGTPSLPSGLLQGWPRGTPVTLQTLATLMISISDNTATDTLIGVLGREAVDATARRYGAQAPVLTTREAFVIKSDAALTRAWAAADPAARRALLATERSRLAEAAVDPMIFSSGPLANDSVEWFAAPRDMARLLAALRDAGPVVRAILAVNHGVDPATAARFAYLGFKGGSEPGVIALDLLAQAKDGRWYAVCGNWHRSDAAVDEAAFLALVTRALATVATPATRP